MKITSSCVSQKAVTMHNKSEMGIHCLWTWSLTGLYYIGLQPYKPVFIRQTQEWVLMERSLIVKVVSTLFLWLSVWSDAIRRLPAYLNILSSNSQSVKAYFRLLEHILYPVIYTFLWSSLFCKKKELEQLINVLANRRASVKSKTQNFKATQKLRNGSLLYFVIVTVANFLRVFKGLFIFEPNDSPSKHISRLFRESQKKFTFYSTNVILDHPHSTTDFLVLAFEIWERCALHMLYWILEAMLAGPIPLTLLVATKAFGEYVNEQSKCVADLKNVVIAYTTLQQISKLLNNVCSHVFLLSTIQINLALMLNLDLLCLNYLDVLSVLTFIAFHCLALYASGWVFKMVDRFRDWLLDKNIWWIFKTSLGEGEHCRFMHQVETCRIGLGTQGIYQCTYGFLAQFGVVMITVFLVGYDK